MGTRYTIPEGARLRVVAVSGKVHVIAEDRSDIDIDPPDRRLMVSDDGHVAETRSKSQNLTIRVPAGLNVSVGSVSGSVTMEGRFGTVKVSTVSGNITVGQADGDADVRSISGDLVVESTGGDCQCNTKSGKIRIGHVGKAARAHTMSGGIEVGTAGQEDVELKTISGRITIRVDAGRAPRARLRSLSGRTRCDCPEGDDFEIKASTLSGSIEVQAAS